MKLFIKNNIKFIIVIVICLIGSSITTLATNYIFNSNEVSYDNTESGLHADEVQGAIDEVFQHATDYSEIKNTIGTGSLTTTNKTLISGVNELNGKLTTVENTLTNRFEKIFDRANATTTVTTKNLNTGKKFSDYKFLLFRYTYDGSDTRFTVLIPRNIFQSASNIVYLQCISGADADIPNQVAVTYVSDTQIKLNVSWASTIVFGVEIYGFKA